MSTQKKERPILFSGPMVRAILNGSKTMTRRVVKPQPGWPFPLWWKGLHYASLRHWLKGSAMEHCPYGVPGDRLWVRERTRVIAHDIAYFNSKIRVRYEADGIVSDWIAYPKRLENERGCPRNWAYDMKCIPYGGIRESSRITLEVTGVRVERVQDIGIADIAREGLVFEYGTGFGTMRHDFRVLWDRINAKRGFSWESNPWVWVVEFRRV